MNPSNRSCGKRVVAGFIPHSLRFLLLLGFCFIRSWGEPPSSAESDSFPSHAVLQLRITKSRARLFVPKDAVHVFQELIDQVNSLLKSRTNWTRQVNQGIRNFLLVMTSLGLTDFLIRPLEKHASPIHRFFFELGNVFGITAIVMLVFWIWVFSISPPFMILSLNDTQAKRMQAKATAMDWIGMVVMLSLMVGLFVLTVAFWNRVGYGG